MKAKLRKQMRAGRRAFGAAEHAARSLSAAKAAIRSGPFRAGKRIALYLPFDGETDTAAIRDAARRRGMRVFVPVIVDKRHSRIRFYPLDGRTRRGTFGIAVPARAGQWVAPRWLDLIIVPLVAVDARGHRLGMGGGFYDRALCFRRSRVHWAGPRLVGLAFERQRASADFADPWDVRLDYLATEAGLHRFAASGT